MWDASLQNKSTIEWKYKNSPQQNPKHDRALYFRGESDGEKKPG